jgi:Dolichyl-phosphate-mannose-protein mannosyltransferase
LPQRLNEKMSKPKISANNQIKTRLTNETPAQSPALTSLKQTPLWVWLLCLTLLMVLFRSGMLHFPLERDESTYAYLGQRFLEGGRPYLDYYEMKPPMIFASFAFLNSIFGYSESGLRWAALFLTWINAGLVFAIASRFYTSKIAGLACFCYLLLTSSPYSTAIVLSSELIVMALALGSIFLAIQWNQSKTKANWMLLGSGFLIALSALTKQTGLLFAIIPAFLVLNTYWTDEKQIKDLVKNSAYFIAGMAIPITLCLVWVISKGAWNDFIYWNFTYLKKYSSALEWKEAKSNLIASFLLVSKNLLGYWCLGILGVLSLLIPNIPSKQRMVLGLLLICGIVPVFLGKRFFLHYWLYLLPILSILITHFCFTAYNSLNSKKFKWIAVFSLTLMLLFPIKELSAIWIKRDFGSIINEMFPGNAFAEDKVLADFLKKRIKPEDTLVALGSETQYYVYFNQKAPSRHFYCPIICRATQNSIIWQNEALDALLKEKPKYLVFPILRYSWGMLEGSDRRYYNGAWKMMREQYKTIACVEINPNRKSNYIFDASAETYIPKTAEYILITERK